TLSRASQSPPAVDLISRARYPRSFFGSEIEHEFGDFAGSAYSSQRVSGLGVFEEIRVIILAHTAALMDLRDYNTGIHCIYSHSFRRKFERRTTRQLIHSGFRYAISQHPGKGSQAGNAGDVYDIALGLY